MLSGHRVPESAAPFSVDVEGSPRRAADKCRSLRLSMSLSFGEMRQ